MRTTKIIAGLILITLTSLVSTAGVNPRIDYRYCGKPVRTIHGQIARSESIKKAFRQIHPCPATMRFTGACPYWAIDHTIPLACGGCDSVSNMAWLPKHLKSCAGKCKDRFERKIYQAPYLIKDTGNCSNEIIIFKQEKK